MASQGKNASLRATGARKTVRASVSLGADLYRTLEALARQKKVSTAWVLRAAAEKYVADELGGLFETKGEGT
jgi:predicted DNA-binding ribbon-helix-helix protein